MTERPILFNSQMVQAILAGNKTQTRRVVKLPGIMPRTSFTITSPDESMIQLDDGTFHYLSTAAMSGPYECPFGKVGDQLWVRETHAIVPRTAYRASDGVEQVLKPNDDHDATIFRADWCRSSGGLRWLPSIHMPRWASRIQLEITAIRIERLNDCSEADAIAEGIKRNKDGWWPYGRQAFCDADGVTPFGYYANPKDSFMSLWESINGYRSWHDNPWVWVIEFKRVERTKEPA